MLASGDCLISPIPAPPGPRSPEEPFMTPEKSTAGSPAQPAVVDVPETFLLILLRALGAIHT